MDWLPGVEVEVDGDGNCDEAEKKSFSVLSARPTREVERDEDPGLEEDSKGGRLISPDSPPEWPLSFNPDEPWFTTEPDVPSAPAGNIMLTRLGAVSPSLRA